MAFHDHDRGSVFRLSGMAAILTWFFSASAGADCTGHAVL